MEETVDPILAKLNGKSKQKPVTVAEEDPILSRLNASKKKEPTVSEPSLNDGSTQAGLGVSQEPGPKGAKPSGKSTESKPGFFNNLKSIWDELVTDFNTTNTQEAPADPLVNAVKRGLNLANQAETISPFNTPTKKDFKDIAKGQAELTTLPSSKEYQKFSSSETFGDALKALKDNPVQIIAELTGESLSSLASYGASRIAAGAGMGAAAGSVVPGIGTAAGAGSGLIVGLADTSLALEYSSKFIEVLKEQGVDVTDEKSLESAFSNDELISKARESAYKKSIPIAIFDLISGGIAGKIVKKPASSLLGKVASGAAEFAVQSGLGGGGELAGQIAAGEKIQPGAIIGEMIGELGTTPVEVMANTAGTIKQGLSTPPSPDVVVSEARTSVKSADDTQGAENAAEKIIATTQSPNATEGQQLTTQTDGQERNGQGRQEELLTQETTGETPSASLPENKSPEAQVQEGTESGQGAAMEFTSTVGENYVKRDNRWFVKDAEGIERPLISDNPNKTIEEQNTELAELKKLKEQLETETPVKVDLSPTGKNRIAEMEAFSPEGRVRKWLFGGGQLLWNSKSQGEGKPTLKGLKDETGYSNKERQDIKQYVHDTNGVSVEQAAEQLAAQYQDRSPQEYRNAIIEVFSSDPKKWYEQQVRDEDPDYAMQEEQRFEEAGQLTEQIKQLETQEEGIKETNQQLYENERRVNYGSSAAEGQAAGGQMASPGNGSQTQVQPRESIRKNGDANKSKQALEELKSKNLTHVPGLGMGQNQAKGTYVSTEDQNRYETEDKKPVKVKVNVQKPFVSEDNVFYDIQREIIQSRFGKEKIEDLTETEADLLAEMVTEHFTTEGFDSIYMPQSETQEGELIVFDRAKVTIMDDARIEYENAVHASTQTTLQLEFVPDAEFLKTDKPIELREKQKKVRKDLARLNQLIKCR